MVELPGTAPGSNPSILTYVYCHSYLRNSTNIGHQIGKVKGLAIRNPFTTRIFFVDIPCIYAINYRHLTRSNHGALCQLPQNKLLK